MGNLPTMPAGMSAESWANTIASRYDRFELQRDLMAVLVAHGVTDLEFVNIDVVEIEQGGMFAGFSFSGMAYQRPVGLPEPDPQETAKRELDVLDALAEKVEGVA